MSDHLEAIHEAASEANALLLRWQLIRVRLRHGLTIETVAERMGRHPAHVRDEMELPESDPTLATLRRYALAVGALIHHEVIPEQIAEPDGGDHE